MMNHKVNPFRIGNQTAFSALRPLDPFEYAVGARFDAFEWFPDKNESNLGWFENDIDAATRRYIKQTALKRDMVLTVHAPVAANPLNPDAIDAFSLTLDFAQEIGAKLLNIHLYMDQGVENYVDSILPLIKTTHARNLKLSIENTPMTSPEDFNRLFNRLNEINETPIDHVGLCLDLGHANLCQATRNDYLKFIDWLNPKIPIIHLHAHENYGDCDNHLPLFTGPSALNQAGIQGYIQRMIQRNFAGALILEQWPEDRTLLNQARNGLIRIISSLLGFDDKRDDQFSTLDQKDKIVFLNQSIQLDLLDNNDFLNQSIQLEHPDNNDLFNQPIPLDRIDKTDFFTQSISLDRIDNNDLLNQSIQLDRQDKNGLLEKIIEAEKQRKSWREKLLWVSDFLTQEKTRPSLNELIDLSIYMRFLGSGAIACSEDGRHFRPCHHASSSQVIQRRLSDITNPNNALIVRKIYPWLPSFDSAYTKKEPLTRIRDIAHRNDIPRDLKQEIKHKLQNKLHRCAGPEDLLTSASILERVTAPNAQFSPDFVREFKIFHQELKEFFNAGALEEQLQRLLTDWDPRETAIVKRFLLTKQRPNHSPRDLVAMLQDLTDIRKQTIARLRSTVDEGEKQRLRLADIAMEEFAFVHVSQTLNLFDHDKEPFDWTLLIQILTLTVRNIGFSGFESLECALIDAHLADLTDYFDSFNRLHGLQLKAICDRSQRIAYRYTDQILSFYTQRAEAVGRALNLKDHTIRTFCEGDIRGNLVFQLSKALGILKKRIRQQLNLTVWDAIVTGKAAGRLVSARHLSKLTLEKNQPTIALIEEAEGDEEIPDSVTGIIVGHELPHLSHLGVRARQSQVVFVSCEEKTALNEIYRYVNKTVVLSATAQDVQIQALYRETIISTQPVCNQAIQPLQTTLNYNQTALKLDEIIAQTGGRKADNVRRLQALARERDLGFKTLDGVVIPYGAMEAALQRNASVYKEYLEIVNGLNGLSSDELDRALSRLRAFIERLPIDEAIISQIRPLHDVSLMVRSSANCEDLARMAGAGLYDSIPNVTGLTIGAAIGKVWASLWTKRAAISRKQSGIAHQDAHIAVLIQPMIAPDYSFILHTANPMSGNRDEIYIELAVGAGEMLASASEPGVPFRMVCHLSTEKVETLSFSSFSHALRPGTDGKLSPEPIDYRKINLFHDHGARDKLTTKIATIGKSIEKAFGYPQDIEGCVLGDSIYVVQTRDQQGLND